MAETTGSNFKQGKTGEAYVRKNIQHLLEHGIVEWIQDTAVDNVEGGDVRIKYLQFGDPVNVTDYLLETDTVASNTGYQIKQILIGGLEVKTIDSFTFRTNDNSEAAGTLPFALWKADDRSKLGWLFEMLYPQLRLKNGNEIHAVQPVLFCFLLISYLGPFACVMFEDFPALAQRLKELAAQKGFSLAPDFPVGDAAQDWGEDDPYIIGPMWHIPFEELSDLATVTMIGDMPMVKLSSELNSGRDYEDLQTNRYNYLVQSAHNRHLDADSQSEIDFYPADSTRIYADVLKNMEIIDQLDAEKYPYLYQALRSLGMKDHLKYILLNMYSRSNPTVINDRFVCFYQAKNYLHQWSKEHGVKGSRFSWQSHVIFLTDTDLLKKYVVMGAPPKVFRSAPKYTPEILHQADKKAKDYIAAGIKLNNYAKDAVIKVSGQERADFLYFGDDRIVSSMQKEVDKAFAETGKQMLQMNRYIIPSEVERVTYETIMSKYGIVLFEEENASPDEINNDLKARRQLNRIKNRYGELSKEIGCDYRELTKQEKIDLQLPTRFRKKVFIR